MSERFRTGVRMRTQDLPQPLEPDTVSIEAVPAERAPVAVQPGDFLLGRAHGPRHRLIKWGQGLRMAPADRVYCGYTHAALVVSADGDLVEAVGAGVRQAHLDDYLHEPYRIVHIGASDEDRRQVVAVAMSALGRRARYNGLATVSIGLWLVTGWPITFFTDGAYTCSGLVARSLLAIGAVFDGDAVKVTPAQLALYFRAPPPQPDPPSAR